MIRVTQSRARLMYGACAAIGVLAAHWLAYRIVTPDPHLRAELLESSGHRFFTVFSAAALGLFAVAVSGALASAAARRTTDSARSASLGAVAARLMILQSAGWLALEGAERLSAAHHHGNLFHEPVFWIGLALQLVVALFSALLFASIECVFAALLGHESRRTTRSRSVAWRVVESTPLRPARLAGLAESRGPPYAPVTS
jgi:hypothetical protein